MSNKSQIEWTDATWNPVTGCSKVSAGCKHCYAERLFPRVYPGRDFGKVRMHKERLPHPGRWRKPRRVFVNSMSDLFHGAVPFEFIDEVFAVMARCQQHIFQVLTKRPERMLVWAQTLFSRRTRLGYGVCTGGSPWPLPNVWLGVSCENQATADARIPLLLQTPAAVRFISAEPLLGQLDLYAYLPDPWSGSAHLGAPYGDLPPLDWVIVGGESGPRARLMDPAWARAIRGQCQATGVAFFLKQMTKKAPIPGDLLIREYPQLSQERVRREYIFQ